MVLHYIVDSQISLTGAHTQCMHDHDVLSGNFKSHTYTPLTTKPTKHGPIKNFHLHISIDGIQRIINFENEILNQK